MTDHLTAEQIEGLLKEATPGPWRWVRDKGFYASWRIAPGVLVVEGGMTDGTPQGDAIDRANARLIVAAPTLARTALDALAEVERLKEEIILMHQDTAGESL